MTAIEGVGPQLQRAAEGTDPRGRLVFAWLPPELQALEDSRAAADRDQFIIRRRGRGFERPATDTERALLQHLGYNLPAQLMTLVKWPTTGVRRRTWPQLESQEATP